MKAAVLLAAFGLAASANFPSEGADAPGPWANFVESDYPFFSSVLDARGLGSGFPDDNLTSRGIVLNLGNDCWACFDTDLLRMAAIWQGVGLTPVSMAQGSYHLAGVKAPEGETSLPRLIGTPWLANGIYPGWQSGEQILLTDPRDPGPDRNEPGRGPLAPSAGRFRSIHLLQGGVSLEYDVAGMLVREWVEARREESHRSVQRRFRLAHLDRPLWLILGHRSSVEASTLKVSLTADLVAGKPVAELHETADHVVAVRVHPSEQAVGFQVAFGPVREITTGAPPAELHVDAPRPPRWPPLITTDATLSPATNAYVVDRIALPIENPWKRNVRLADLAFLRDGRAAAVTFDGDVWMISGLRHNLEQVAWRRFTSGLHEPLGVCVRDDEVFVHDRNGVWRLRDTDGDGEADRHELFSNAFAQTAETREFASGLRVGPDGSFVIGKGGQRGTTLGKHSGTVLRLSPDGTAVQVLGHGLRQPFIGVHPRTGLVTASDQQGHYVPATPLYVIRDDEYHGFIPLLLPREQHPEPIADPLTWIPHPINASGAGQVWLTDARMGPLNGKLIHLGYFRPEVFLVLLNPRASRMQAAVLSLTRDLDFAPLAGAVNPVDGQLYLTGFQIWGSTARQVSGLARLRYTGGPSTVPREVVPMDSGVLLRFDVALDAKAAAEPANYSAERWNYQRTANYGSPHFKPDGTKGQEAMTPSSAYVSRDRRGIFVGIPDMKAVMQMRLGWTLATADGTSLVHNIYFTPSQLTTFDPGAEGFEPVSVDLKPRQVAAAPPTPVDVPEGQRLSELMGCIACHSVDGSAVGKVGPTWKGLFGSYRLLTDGSAAVATEGYLRESIREPAAKVARGFENSDAGMPSYEGVISEAQVEALILYIKTLR